jgi:hypothetical protein
MPLLLIPLVKVSSGDNNVIGKRLLITKQYLDEIVTLNEIWTL